MRYFSGDDGDHREYRRWKQWVQSKMLTMDKLSREARGAFVFTLLQGRALEVVEHLKAEEYQKDGGDLVLFGLLDKRWPQKDRADELGEHVSEVFLLAAKDGESIRAWSSRAQEVFDRCKRKTEVSFPEEARGWITLHRSGLSEEQRAVVLARCGGSLKFDDVAQAMRSCYPEYIVPKRRVNAAHYMEEEGEAWYTDGYGQADYAEPEHIPDEPEVAFGDVELFLAEHDLYEPQDEVEVFPEKEVAEVLAATWKDKRAELARLQKSRRFSQMRDVKRSFRVEVEELKKKTQCHRCGRTGHWARECRMPKTTAASGAGAASSSSSGPSGAGLVQNERPDFVCVVTLNVPPNRGYSSMLAQVRERVANSSDSLYLISSPGYAVLDSGCGRSVIGAETLAQFQSLWRQAGIGPASEVPEQNSFRFGNGHLEVSSRVVEMPLFLAGKQGRVRAAVIKGKAPLLLSRTALKKLHAQVDFGKDEMVLFQEGIRIPLQVNEAGQYVVPVLDKEPMEPPASMSIEEGKIADPPGKAAAKVAGQGSSVLIAEDLRDYWEVQGSQVVRVHQCPRSSLFQPSDVLDCPVPLEQLTSQRVTQGNCADGSPISLSGLVTPDGVPVQKNLRLLVSHAHMRSLSRACPGHNRHHCPAGPQTSLGRFAMQYPSGFVRSMLRTVKTLARTEALLVQAGTDKECLVAARVQQFNEQKREQMMQSLLRLHVNLGHPSCSNLARVLKHGGASQEAIDLAREVVCDVCRAQKPPVPPPPAQTNRATHFNQRVGLDVKYLPGWQPNQKIPCLNIVDFASSYQVMVPLAGRATGESLRQALQERWITWAGVPEEIIVDPDQANLSAALTVPQELAGTHVSSTAAEAHWQLGKVEVHGGWFSRVLEKVLAEAMPHDRSTWLECVFAAHCKNELIQVYGMTPAQYVFGRNPRVPTDLLDEPLQVIPATASLHEESLARRVAVRQAARKAVIELQDDIRPFDLGCKLELGG